MEILQRAEKIAREMHPDAVRDLATAKQASSWVILFSVDNFSGERLVCGFFLDLI